MLNPNLLHNEPDAVVEKPASRGFKPDADKLRTLEEHRKVPQVQTENLQVERNFRSKSIGQAKVRGEDIEFLRLEVNKLGEELNTAKTELDILQVEIRDTALATSNLPADDVPVGKDENDNVEVSRWGIPREFDSEVYDHVILGEMCTGLDSTVAVRLTDSRFTVMKGQVVHMHCALSQFMLDLHTEQHGYNENYVPYLVSHDTLYGTGQLPKFAGDLFHTHSLDEGVDSSNYVLIPMAEAPLTNLVRDEITDEDALPIKMTAYTPCFCSETGSYSRDTRGLIHIYQPDKVEMVQIVHPEDSMDTSEEMAGHAEKVLQLLGLLHREIILCTSGIGFGACKTYDPEVWILAQNTYHEISLCSNTWGFQARRMQARCRSKFDKKIRLVHTLNGPGLAVGRTLVAVMENYQQANGRTQVLKVLRPYMNGLEFIG